MWQEQTSVQSVCGEHMSCFHVGISVESGGISIESGGSVRYPYQQ